MRGTRQKIIKLEEEIFLLLICPHLVTKQKIIKNIFASSSSFIIIHAFVSPSFLGRVTSSEVNLFPVMSQVEFLPLLPSIVGCLLSVKSKWMFF